MRFLCADSHCWFKFEANHGAAETKLMIWGTKSLSYVKIKPICSTWIVLIDYTFSMYSHCNLNTLYVPTSRNSVANQFFNLFWDYYAPERSTPPGCCVFQRLSRGSPGIVCEEESYRRICTRLELPTVTFLFCHKDFFFPPFSAAVVGGLQQAARTCNADIAHSVLSWLKDAKIKRVSVGAAKGEPLQYVSFTDGSGDFSAVRRST